MKATAFGMFGFLVVLMGIAIWQGGEVFKTGLLTSASQFKSFLPVLIIAILLAGFTEVLLPQGFVEKWLSDSAGWRGIVIAWIAGIITPGGSIVGLPIIAGLYKTGVGIAVLMTYATSLATLSLIRIPIEVSFYGWHLTLIRIGVSITLPLIAGGLTLVLVKFVNVG